MDAKFAGTAPEAYQLLSSALASTLGSLPLSQLAGLDPGSSTAGTEPLANATNWVVMACDTADGTLAPASQNDLAHPVWQEVAALDLPTLPLGGLALENHLAFVFPAEQGGPARLAAISDVDLTDGLVGLLETDQSLTPGEMRLLKLLLCGTGLSAAAQIDNVSHETKRSQFKSLTRKLGTRSQPELASRVLFHLLVDGMSQSAPRAASDADLLSDLVEQFIPGARTLQLRSARGTWHRLIDIGPVSGRPVIMLHSQILPDLRPQDIALLDAARVRLIVPLRNGAMAGSSRELAIDDHLDHACEGIDLARALLCGDRADLLVCVSGCTYGIEYAHRFPERVRSIVFLGACVQPLTGRGLAGRMRSGLFSLARTHWGLLSKALVFFGGRIQRAASFRRFLQRHYASCPSDLAIVAAEFALPHRGERTRRFMTSSIESIKHDFFHQAVPRWDRFPAGRFPAAFIHGAEDFIHELDDVHSLAEAYGGLPVFTIPGAGQLLYHSHFAPTVKAYTAFLAGI